MNCFHHEDIRHGDIGTESASTSIRMNSSSLGSPPIMFVLRLHAKTKTTPIQNFMYQNKPRRLRGRGNRSDSLLLHVTTSTFFIRVQKREFSTPCAVRWSGKQFEIEILHENMRVLSSLLYFSYNTYASIQMTKPLYFEVQTLQCKYRRAKSRSTVYFLYNSTQSIALQQS